MYLGYWRICFSEQVGVHDGFVPSVFRRRCLAGSDKSLLVEMPVQLNP
jgi:hypothetical protein